MHLRGARALADEDAQAVYNRGDWYRAEDGTVLDPNGGGCWLSPDGRLVCDGSGPPPISLPTLREVRSGHYSYDPSPLTGAQVTPFCGTYTLSTWRGHYVDQQQGVCNGLPDGAPPRILPGIPGLDIPPTPGPGTWADGCPRVEGESFVEAICMNNRVVCRHCGCAEIHHYRPIECTEFSAGSRGLACSSEDWEDAEDAGAFAQEELGYYCGIPGCCSTTVVTLQERCWGQLCHWDVVSRENHTDCSGASECAADP